MMMMMRRRKRTHSAREVHCGGSMPPIRMRRCRCSVPPKAQQGRYVGSRCSCLPIPLAVKYEKWRHDEDVMTQIESTCHNPSRRVIVSRDPNRKNHEGHRHLPTTNNNVTRRQQWLVPLFRQTSCANFAVKKRCAGLIGCHLGWCLGLHNFTIRGSSRRWWSGGQAIAA